jgi:hypothetical protein
MGGAPLAVFPGAVEGADAGAIQHGTMDATESIFHSQVHGAGHLATALLAKGLDLCGLAVK